MLKISDFSKLTYVSVKTLRYYDDIGIFQPSQVDKFTGYRYYTAAQLPRLNKILALKELGLSLEQIKQLLDANLSTEQIRGMLLMKRLETLKHLDEMQARLLYVENKLNQLDLEGKLSEYEVIIKSVPAIRAATLASITPDWASITPTLNQMFDTLYGAIVQSGARLVENPAECGITFYLDTEHREKDIQLEVAFGIMGDMKDENGVIVKTYPPVEMMASVIHKGSFATLPNAYDAIAHWIESSGYEIVGANREINLEYERLGDPNKYVTEVQFPVKKK